MDDESYPGDLTMDDLERLVVTVKSNLYDYENYKDSEIREELSRYINSE